MNIVTEYIKYRWNAKKRHGIHSPFVYELSDECANTVFPKELRVKRKNLFDQIRGSELSIHVTDLGAGSQKMGHSRKVKNILKHSSSGKKWGEVLYKLSHHFKPKNILELGTSLGIGTWHLYQGYTNTNITTIEGCPETHEAMKTLVYPQMGNQVTSICASFRAFLDKLTNEEFDLIFIDGHHDGKALETYVQRLLPFTHADTIFILDDIRWSDSMYEAWMKLQNDPSFHVSIDLFRMGILVQRPSQEKEHFVLKL